MCLAEASKRLQRGRLQDVSWAVAEEDGAAKFFHGVLSLELVVQGTHVVGADTCLYLLPVDGDPLAWVHAGLFIPGEVVDRQPNNRCPTLWLCVSMAAPWWFPSLL